MSTQRIILTALTVALSGCTSNRICAVPGDRMNIPTPIGNHTETGEPGGDTITAMKVVIVSSSSVVTQVKESATEAIPPGATVTFVPSFVVNPDARPGTRFRIWLRTLSDDDGILDLEKEDPVDFVVRKSCEKERKK